MAKTTCKLSLLTPAVITLFGGDKQAAAFLRKVKAMPRQENVQPPKLPEDFGLFYKDGSYQLVYYIKDGGKLVTRHLSLKTESICDAREMRDAVIAATGTSERKFAATGLRGARWVEANPHGMEGVHVTVRINGPERQRVFRASGDKANNVIETAMQWRRDAAAKFIKDNTQ